LKVDSEKSDSDTSINDKGELVVGANQESGPLSISSDYTDPDGKTVIITPAVVVVIDSDTKSIKDKFSVVMEGTDAVTGTFTALHLFIQNGGLVEHPDVIKLGDWIDLEGGLTVEAYKEAGGFSSSDVQNWDVEIGEGPESQGKLNRLIVVGINSFQTGKGVGDRYVYPAGEEDPPPHVVFQFQNIPVKRQMDPVASTGGGYPAKEMRKYLTRVDGDNNSGMFLAGLEKAGVPEDVLWPPVRIVSARKSSQQPTEETLRIQDKLWLPTEREMFGARVSSFTDETESNQARLEYYSTDSFRKKVDESKTAQVYFLASMMTHVEPNSFCAVKSNGAPKNSQQLETAITNTQNGVAPAFCVY
jgi:hypothetical protein